MPICIPVIGTREGALQRRTQAPLSWVTRLRWFADDFSTALLILKILLFDICSFIGFFYLLYRLHFWSR
jgi:hypothetical protein